MCLCVCVCVCRKKCVSLGEDVVISDGDEVITHVNKITDFQDGRNIETMGEGRDCIASFNTHTHTHTHNIENNRFIFDII